MGLSDIVRAAERRINRRGVERKTAAGWAPEIQPYRGYGTAQRIHVIGRILMEDPEFDDNGDPRSQMEQVTQQAQRGYRQFFTIQVGDLPVTTGSTSVGRKSGSKPKTPSRSPRRCWSPPTTRRWG